MVVGAAVYVQATKQIGFAGDPYYLRNASLVAAVGVCRKLMRNVSWVFAR
jgi:hypothetical protein